MKELLNAVYRRKSARKYSGTLTDGELSLVKDYLTKIKPLCPELRVEYEILPIAETNCKFNGEYCLLAYSEEGNLWLANIGYLLEQWDLYLASLNIGVCWYGMGKVEQTKKNGLTYGIMLCFGKCGEDDFRKDASEFNRKKASEIWQGATNAKLPEIVRLAPSAVNSQPWQVVEEGNALKVYRVKGNTPVLSGVLFKHWNKVDIGIFLAFLDVALESEGYVFSRELHPDTDGKKRVLTATYTLSK